MAASPARQRLALLPFRHESSLGEAVAPIGFSFDGEAMSTEKATFGAGCFWGVEAIFRQTNGVKDVAVGYAGGKTEDPTYEDVYSDETGHAEVVEVSLTPRRFPSRSCWTFSGATMILPRAIVRAPTLVRNTARLFSTSRPNKKPPLKPNWPNWKRVDVFGDRSSRRSSPHQYSIARKNIISSISRSTDARIVRFDCDGRIGLAGHI